MSLPFRSQNIALKAENCFVRASAGVKAETENIDWMQTAGHQSRGVREAEID